MESFGCCCDAKKPDEPIQIVHQPPEPEPLDCKWQRAHSSIETSKESCGSELTGHLSARELRLQSMNVLEVDVSIIRRISVAASLRARGRLWLSSPADLDETTRSKLWHKSQPGDHFDIFFSHSWKTRGLWKVLSLLFQYGWPHILTCWAGVVTLVFILCCFGLLPAPLRMVMSVLDFHQPDMEFTPWVYLSGGISALLSLLFAPYVMHWSPQCFLDVAFLMMLGNYLAAAIYLSLFAFPGTTILNYLPMVVAVTLAPLFIIVHGNRIFMREKYQLIADLDRFQLEEADCLLEEDRQFILTCIREWYGSEVEFTKYVRGDLRQELLDMSAIDLPLSYGLVIILGPLGVALDVIAAMIHHHASMQSVLSELIGSALAWTCFGTLLCLKLMWWLCDYFAAKHSSPLLDLGISLFIFLIVFMVYASSAVISAVVYPVTLWGAVAYSLVGLFLVGLIYGRRLSLSSILQTNMLHRWLQRSPSGA